MYNSSTFAKGRLPHHLTYGIGCKSTQKVLKKVRSRLFITGKLSYNSHAMWLSSYWTEPSCRYNTKLSIFVQCYKFQLALHRSCQCPSHYSIPPTTFTYYSNAVLCSSASFAVAAPWTALLSQPPMPMPMPTSEAAVILTSIELNSCLLLAWRPGGAQGYYANEIELLLKTFNHFYPKVFLCDGWSLVMQSVSLASVLSLSLGKNCDCSRSCPGWWNWKHICSCSSILVRMLGSENLDMIPSILLHQKVMLLMLMPHMRDHSLIRSSKHQHHECNGTWFCKSSVEFVVVNGRRSVNKARLL